MTDQQQMQDTMFDLEQWVVWKLEERDGKPTKVPYRPAYGPPSTMKRASATDPETWATHKVARVVLQRSKMDGIGFVFTEDDPYVGIDLDSLKDEDGNITENVIDPETEEIAPWAWEIMERLDSYTEISQSGTGLHIIALGTFPEEARHRNGQIEIYDQGRYFAYTGHHLAGTKEHPQLRQDELEEMISSPVFDGYHEHAREVLSEASEASKTRTKPEGEGLPDLTTEGFLELAAKASNSSLITALWNGNIQGHKSQSEADLSLADKIAFYTGPNPEAVERIFGDSALADRDKWNRPDIRRRLSTKAIKRDTFYTPPRQSQRQPQSEKNWTVGQLGQLDSSISKRKAAKKSSVDDRGPLDDVPPFPVEAMPQACQDLITDGSHALGCTQDFIATAMLSALSGGIGATRSIMVKKGWTEHSGLFLAVVGDPGSMKSPAVKIALNPVYKLNKSYQAEFQKKNDDHKRALREYEVEKRESAKEGRPASPPPEPPTMKSTIVVDTTMEALSEVLVRNLRGLVVHRDELTGWLRSMDQYKSGGKGSDRSHWLSVWDNQDLVIHRKSNIDEPIIITTPLVSLIGGIQPAMLGELGGPMEDGLMERFLFAYPNVRALKHNWYEIRDSATEDYANLYHKLMSLQGGLSDGQISPRPLHMSFEAKKKFGPILDEISTEAIQPGFPPRMQAAWSKMRGYLARLSLIVAVCRFHTSEAEVEQVEVEDIDNAYTLLKYFMAHARRIYGAVNAASPEDIFAGALKTFLENNGGKWNSTPSDLLDALTEAEIASLPDSPEGTTKMIKRVADTSKGLYVQTGKKRGQRVVEIGLFRELPDHELEPIVTNNSEPTDNEEKTVQTVQTVHAAKKAHRTADSSGKNSGQFIGRLQAEEKTVHESLDGSNELKPELSTNRPDERPIDKGNRTVGQLGQLPSRGHGTKKGEINPMTGEAIEEGMCKHDQWPTNCHICNKIET